jgi:exosortase B
MSVNGGNPGVRAVPAHALARNPNAAVAGGDFKLAMLIALLGFAAMYVPVYWGAANSIWQTEEQAHGAIILLVEIWLFWGVRDKIEAAPAEPSRVLGWMLLVMGLVLFLAGRVLRITVLEFGTQPFVIAGALLILKGPAAARIAAFPILYLFFMVPLPGTFVDAITATLKTLIANVVESLLFFAGYPISRDGVVLSIGPYQLQVADACSGIHSMFSLSALGVLFMFVMARKSRLHNFIMVASILPIAFAANIVRVITLVLVTYYFGDAAGQGYLHGLAGGVVMLAALIILLVLDSLLARFLGRPVKQAGSAVGLGHR